MNSTTTNQAPNLPPKGPQPTIVLHMDRRPTSADTKYRDGSFYVPGTQIRNTSTSPAEIWELASFSAGLAQWTMLSGASGPTIAFNVDASTLPGTNPVLASGSGEVTITGAQVASGTVGANVIRTDSLAANTFTIEIQRSTALASTDSSKNGVCHFNNAQFTVDSSGFVSITDLIGTWIDQTTTPQTLAINTGYVADLGSLITFTLPTTAAFGTIIRIVGKGSGLFTIAQNASQSIRIAGSTSTVGTGGSVAATTAFCQVELLCTTANTVWTALSVTDNFVVT